MADFRYYPVDLITAVPSIFFYLLLLFSWGFPGGPLVKNSPPNAGDVRVVGLIPGSGKSPGGELGDPLPYSYLEDPMAGYGP